MLDRERHLRASDVPEAAEIIDEVRVSGNEA
jgi:hypothetical protein